MVECSKYYLVNLYKRHYSVQLFENRELDSNEYSLASRSTRFYVYTLRKQDDSFRFSKMNIEVPYKCYSLHSIECKGINDYLTDGFYYDSSKKIILYGTAKIYAYKKGHSYYEVITGLEIPDIEAHSMLEIKYVKDLQKMQTDLSCIRNHFSLYKFIVWDSIYKLSNGYHNYVDAYNQFLEMQKLYLEKMRQEGMISAFCAEMQRLESEKDLLALERENVKNLILEIQKSP